MHSFAVRLMHFALPVLCLFVSMQLAAVSGIVAPDTPRSRTTVVNEQIAVQSVAASPPAAALLVKGAATSEASKPVPALTQHVEGLSLYQHDTGDFVQSYQGQISGAASGTSSAGTAGGGHRASKGDGGAGDQHSSDSPVRSACMHCLCCSA